MRTERFIKWTIATGLVALTIITNVSAQEEAEKKAFEPSIQPYVKVFSNIHQDLYGADQFAFDVDRAYFGTKLGISENFSGNVLIDFGDPKNASAFVNTAYLKLAALTYKRSKLSIDFGLIGLDHFKTQENFWGHRYVYKSALDEYKFSHSADLGATLRYGFSEKFSVDATVRNGEGYKELQTDNTVRAGAGLTIVPVSGLTIRLYYDAMDKGELQSMGTFFAGYEMKDKFRIGAEYTSSFNYKFTEDCSLSVLSAYAAFQLSEKFEIFGRYDLLHSNTLSNTTSPWNESKDGSAIIGGLQFKAHKNVKIALNQQGWMPADGSDYEPAVYLNLEYKFN